MRLRKLVMRMGLTLYNIFISEVGSGESTLCITLKESRFHANDSWQSVNDFLQTCAQVIISYLKVIVYHTLSACAPNGHLKVDALLIPVDLLSS